MKFIQPIDPTPVRNLLDNNQDDALQCTNSLLKTLRTNTSVKTQYFFLPHNAGKPKWPQTYKKLYLTELYKLEILERLDPHVNQSTRDQSLSNFHWTDSTLNEQKKMSIEKILVQFKDFFARHRLNNGINNDFQIKLPPLDDRAAYS